MGQRVSISAWERIGRVRYKAIADGRVEIAVFLNAVLLFMEKKATADQRLRELERDRLLQALRHKYHIRGPTVYYQST